jgi:hypothetical protein
LRAARERPLVDSCQSPPHSDIISFRCACLSALMLLGRSLLPSTSPDASADSSPPSPTTSNNSLLLTQLPLVSTLFSPSNSLHTLSALLLLSNNTLTTPETRPCTCSRFSCSFSFASSCLSVPSFTNSSANLFPMIPQWHATRQDVLRDLVLSQPLQELVDRETEDLARTRRWVDG